MNITAHTNSQSQTVKVGAVNKASTDHPFTNWKSEMRGKMELCEWTINFDHTIKLIKD